MPIFDTYAKRLRRLKGSMQDVFDYDRIQKKLKTQIVLLYREAINDENYQQFSEQVYSEFVTILRHETGVFSLSHECSPYDSEIELTSYFLSEKPAEDDLTII